jgi:hypothetical protein
MELPKNFEILFIGAYIALYVFAVIFEIYQNKKRKN